MKHSYETPNSFPIHIELESYGEIETYVIQDMGEYENFIEYDKNTYTDKLNRRMYSGFMSVLSSKVNSLMDNQNFVSLGFMGIAKYSVTTY